MVVQTSSLVKVIQTTAEGVHVLLRTALLFLLVIPQFPVFGFKRRLPFFKRNSGGLWAEPVAVHLSMSAILADLPTLLTSDVGTTGVRAPLQSYSLLLSLLPVVPDC